MNKEQKTTKNKKATNKNIKILKRHFSHCFKKNGEFDFEKFKQELSAQEINFYKESYGMDWLGKSYARILASDNATTLLKEDDKFNQREENNNSQNILIKGDNLEVLKHLSNAYYEKIKMIYIDPPYNTGSDGFVYKDNRKFTPEKFKKLAGINKNKAERILSFINSKSNSHSAWLTFMYPRLYIAKQLLRDDGVIFVSIDDNEVAQLRLLMDEIFGEENFVALLSVENNPKGRKNSDFVSVTNDYCLIYVKNKENSSFIENIPKNINDMTQDENGIYIHKSGKRVLVGENNFNKEVLNFKSEKHYSVYFNKTTNDLIIRKENKISEIDNNLLHKGFKRYVSSRNNKFIENTYTKQKLLDLFKQNALDFKDKIYEKNFNSKIRIKSILKNDEYDAIVHSKKQKYKIDLKTTSAGTYINDLFKIKNIFKAPKNPSFIKLLLTLFEEDNFFILDFFAGSGTTGDAVMQLNAEDGGNRKYILVQLPEPIAPTKNKTAYNFIKEKLKVEKPTIFEITKERLIRASKKIKEETIKTKIAEKQKEIKDLENQLDIDNKKEKINQLQKEIKALKNQDLGFKIFKTIPIWEDYGFETDELEELKLFDESKLNDDDLKALLITWKTYDGLPLTTTLVEIDLNGYKSYYGEGNSGNKLYFIHKGFITNNLKFLLEKIDSDKNFNPTSIIVFGYNFESKNLREIAENIKLYTNKKNIDIDFITRY